MIYAVAGLLVPAKNHKFKNYQQIYRWGKSEAAISMASCAFNDLNLNHQQIYKAHIDKHTHSCAKAEEPAITGIMI